MTSQPFGDYARWYPRVHVLLADGPFRENGIFYVMPKADLASPAELFRANVLRMPNKERWINDALIANLPAYSAPAASFKETAPGFVRNSGAEFKLTIIRAMT